MNTNEAEREPTNLNAEPADLYLALGNVVYALANVDGRIQDAETQLARQLLSEQPHGELALHAFFLLENCAVPVEEAYAFAMRRFINNRKALSEPIKKHFVDILVRIADAHDDTSTKEQALIKRFRRDLRRL